MLFALAGRILLTRLLSPLCYCLFGSEDLTASTAVKELVAPLRHLFLGVLLSAPPRFAKLPLPEPPPTFLPPRLPNDCVALELKAWPKLRLAWGFFTLRRATSFAS